MKIFIIYICLPILVFCARAQQTDSVTHRLALNGIDLATNLQYEEAVEKFNRIIELQPANPKGYFLKSATYFWMFSADMHNEKLGDEFKDHSWEAVRIAEERLDLDENDIDAMFYLGGAYGSLGRYYGMTKSYLNAYWYGKKGMNILEDVIEIDSTYYDAYLGLGIYHYLADVLPRFVKMLSFILGIQGDRERGIRELNLAVERGVYTKTEAMFFLGAIYTYREREFEKARDIWNRLLTKYPGNPGVLVQLGRCYSNMGYCDEALEIYDEILLQKEKLHLIPISSIHYQLGRLYFNMNNFEAAIPSFHESLATDTVYSGNRRWTYAWSHYWLGQSYEMIDDSARALKHYNEIDEDDSERAYDRANEAIENPKSEMDKKFNIGRNFVRCGEFDSALRYFDTEFPDLPDTVGKKAAQRFIQKEFHIGEIYFKQKKYDEAVNKFNRVLVEQGVEDQWLLDWSYYYRGSSLEALGQHERAIADFERAVESDDFILADRAKKKQMNLQKE